ncbi:Wzz/FepE/Etk N-terminal domain-containing protein [Cohnella cellulosilytica]|uniref:Wzz/FepE/Etk N-terminal domain-containing protein n=1 Tax=Cohnella cellulosilytica TaxID=986710 RepID=A0ABW2FAC6_9BACL
MDQEISLREIIDIILKGKWIIIIVTVVAVLLTGIISFFVLSPVYESNSMVRIADSSQEGTKPLEMNSFVESIKSDTAINRLIEKLDLDPTVHTINSVKGQIHTEAIKEINVMKIKVTGPDSRVNTNIANFLAYELGNRIDSTARSRSIVEDQSKLMNLSDEIESTKSQLNEANKQLAAIPEKQSTIQVVGESPLLTAIAQEATGSASDVLGLQLQSEVVNPAYTAVQTQIATFSIALTKLLAEEASIKARIQENTDRINLQGNQIDPEKLAGKTSDRLLDGEQAIFVSPALMSTIPVGPNKLMNVIIATIISIIISTTIVFFRHYIRQALKSLDK